MIVSLLGLVRNLLLTLRSSYRRSLPLINLRSTFVWLHPVTSLLTLTRVVRLSDLCYTNTTDFVREDRSLNLMTLEYLRVGLVKPIFRNCNSNSRSFCHTQEAHSNHNSFFVCGKISSDLSKNNVEIFIIFYLDLEFCFLLAKCVFKENHPLKKIN